MCRQYIIHGKVQGVFFRESTRRKAESIGLRGSATNRADGTVEVVACGEDAAHSELAAWLETGPPMASVTKVEPNETVCRKPEAFSTA